MWCKAGIAPALKGFAQRQGNPGTTNLARSLISKTKNLPKTTQEQVKIEMFEKVKKKTIKSDFCQIVAAYDPLGVQCDRCEFWFHFPCVRIKCAQSKYWYCQNC